MCGYDGEAAGGTVSPVFVLKGEGQENVFWIPMAYYYRDYCDALC